jgi:hypothetical protein
MEVWTNLAVTVPLVSLSSSTPLTDTQRERESERAERSESGWHQGARAALSHWYGGGGGDRAAYAPLCQASNRLQSGGAG